MKKVFGFIKKFFPTILVVVGVLMFLIALSNFDSATTGPYKYDRDMNSYYTYIDSWRYFEFTTDKPISRVDAYIYDNFLDRNETITLELEDDEYDDGVYESTYYILRSPSTYNLISLHAYDDYGYIMSLSEYTEQQESYRKESIKNEIYSQQKDLGTCVTLAVVGFVLIVAGVIAFIIKKNSKLVGGSVLVTEEIFTIPEEDEVPVEKPDNNTKTCKYCGTINDAKSMKCSGCGANIIK